MKTSKYITAYNLNGEETINDISHQYRVLAYIKIPISKFTDVPLTTPEVRGKPIGIDPRLGVLGKGPVISAIGNKAFVLKVPKWIDTIGAVIGVERDGLPAMVLKSTELRGTPFANNVFIISTNTREHREDGSVYDHNNRSVYLALFSSTTPKKSKYLTCRSKTGEIVFSGNYFYPKIEACGFLNNSMGEADPVLPYEVRDWFFSSEAQGSGFGYGGESAFVKAKDEFFNYDRRDWADREDYEVHAEMYSTWTNKHLDVVTGRCYQHKEDVTSNIPDFPVSSKMLADGLEDCVFKASRNYAYDMENRLKALLRKKEILTTVFPFGNFSKFVAERGRNIEGVFPLSAPTPTLIRGKLNWKGSVYMTGVSYEDNSFLWIIRDLQCGLPPVSPTMMYLTFNITEFIKHRRPYTVEEFYSLIEKDELEH